MSGAATTTRRPPATTTTTTTTMSSTIRDSTQSRWHTCRVSISGDCLEPAVRTQKLQTLCYSTFRPNKQLIPSLFLPASQNITYDLAAVKHLEAAKQESFSISRKYLPLMIFAHHNYHNHHTISRYGLPIITITASVRYYSSVLYTSGLLAKECWYCNMGFLQQSDKMHCNWHWWLPPSSVSIGYYSKKLFESLKINNNTNYCILRLKFELLFTVLHYCLTFAYILNKLCRRPPQYAPARLQADIWPFDLESSVRVTWATSVPILVFLGLCSRLRPDVRDRQMSDAHHCLMALPYGRGHNKNACGHMLQILLNSLNHQPSMPIIQWQNLDITNNYEFKLYT